MAGYTLGRPGWLETLDMQPIIDGFNESEGDTLLVDVGGSYGQDMKRFVASYPDAPGRIILQDLPPVIEKAEKIKNVEPMAYDFFTPQPIKGEMLPFQVC